MRAGEKLAVRLRASTPEGKAAGTSAVAAFFAPGRDPEHDPLDRDPDVRVPLSFDPVTRTWGAEVPTAGWRPGNWIMQGTVLGPGGVPEGWEYRRVTLDP